MHLSPAARLWGLRPQAHLPASERLGPAGSARVVHNSVLIFAFSSIRDVYMHLI